VGVVRFFQWIRLDDLLFIGLDLLAALLIFRISESLIARAQKRKEADVDPVTEYDPLWTSAVYETAQYDICLTCVGTCFTRLRL